MAFIRLLPAMRFVIITYLLLTTAILSAQDMSFHHPVDKALDFGFEIDVGAKISNIKNLNTILNNEGLPESKTTLMYLGGGMNFTYGNHFFHLSGNAAFDEEGKDLNGYRNLTRGYGVGIHYGYRFDLAVYLIPEIGISRDALIVEIEELPNQNSSIQNQLNNSNISKLKSEVFAASLGFRLLFPTDNGILFPGLNFSYQIPIKTEWPTGDFETTGTPNINNARFKIGIEILFLTGQNGW